MCPARAVVLACLCLTLGSPATPQVAPAAPSSAGMRSGSDRGRASANVDLPPPVTPSLPTWGGGPPPPSPFDQPVPGGPSSSMVPRPGVDAFRAAPDTYTPRFNPRGFDGRRDDGLRPGRHRGDFSGIVVNPPLGGVYIGASPYYYYPTVTAPVAQPAPAAPRADPEGFLRLLIAPRNAGVFVDGVYEGTVDDFGGASERAIRAGPHTVRVEAEGFEPVEFDVRVPANDTITLRRDLDPRRAPAPKAAPSAAATPKTIYLIPRCYLGDSRPLQSQLPAGCSLADLQTLN